MDDKRLNVKFRTYDLPMLTKDDDKIIINFLTITAMVGLKDNIILGNFQERGAENEE